MTFSLAGSVITQTNEAGIAITAAASITGGVRFTCTQAYAAGNLVRITGTTNYNGEWIVAAATGTTFDVQFSAKGDALVFVSSQSGTAARGDSSLAAIAGIAGVTTRAINQGYLVTHTTYLMNLRLVVTGSLRISPQLEMLEFGTTAPLNELIVNSGGVLSVVERYGATYGTHQWKRITRIRNASGQEHWNQSAGSMIVASGGTWNWAGGSMAITSVWTSGTTTIDFGVFNGQPFLTGGSSSDVGYFTDNGGTLVVNALVIGRAGQFRALSPANVSRTYLNLSGTPGSLITEGATGAGGSPTVVYTLINPPSGASGFSITGTRGSRNSIVNAVQGSSSSLSVGFFDFSINFLNNRIEFRKRVTFQYRTPALAAIQNVHVFIRDTNNGLRSNRTNDNYTNDRTYLGTSNASGLTSQLEILTAAVYPTSNVNATPVYDRRSVSNDGNDVFRVGSHAYTHLLSDLSIPMLGTGDLNQGVTMFADTAVTLSQSAAAALATIATLDNFYDAAKNWKCQANSERLEYPTLFSQPVNAAGTTVDLGSLNILVDATAAAAFAINTGTNTITIKSTTLAAGTKFDTLKTAGTISFANGADASCTLQGIVVRGTTGVYSPKLQTATLRFTAAGTYDLRGATISGTITLINTSAGAVTVQLQPGVTFVNSGPSITVDNAATVTLTVNNIVAGSRIQIYNATTATEIVNQVVTGTSFVYNYTETVGITNGNLIRVRLAYQSGITARVGFQTFGLASLSNWTILADQQTDTVYGGIGIDGSTVSEFSPDYPNIQVDINDPDGVTTLSRLYAWFSYICTSADGVRNWLGGIIAEDNANFKIVTSLLDLRLDNVAASGVQFVGDIRLFRDDGAAPVVATTTGGGSITLYAGKVYVVSTGGSALTPSESAKLMGLPDSAANASAVLTAAQAAPIHADVRKANNVAVVATDGSTLTPSQSAKLLGLPDGSTNAAAVLAAAQSTPIHADIRAVNAITVDGAGTEANPFGPA